MRPRVLVVDDDRDVRELLARVLELDGYDVDRAANGDEALAVAAARRPDVVVTDVSMPGLDGPGLLAALDARGMGRIPVVVISADHPPEALRTRYFLQKPFDVDDVVALVTALTLRLAA